MTISSNAYIQVQMHPSGAEPEIRGSYFWRDMEHHQRYSNHWGRIALALLNIIDYSELSIFVF